MSKIKSTSRSVLAFRTGLDLLQRQIGSASRSDGSDRDRRPSPSELRELLQTSTSRLRGTTIVIKKAYFIGIGGIGMSALARYFLALNKVEGKAPKWSVSGSDLTASGITKELAKEGIKVKIGHKKNHIKSNLDMVVYNRAISGQNPELVAARSLGIRIIPYAQLLGAITKKYTTIAITGSHGKTTTTALTGLVLMKGGLNPSIFVGTNLKELGNKNFRLGRKYMVLEADDFGGAFLEYSPTVAIITNIDKEHLDFYKNFPNLKKAFLKFLTRTKNGGVFILNRDDKCLRSLRSKIREIAKKKKVRTVWYSLSNPSIRKIKKSISIPGEHNLSNAEAAYHVGKILKIPEKKIFEAIRGYREAWRRMEYRGTYQVSGVRYQVFDDYTHHPTQIKATLKAFREKFPRSKIICVFQPHQTKRLKLLFKEFQTAFDSADITIILPVYQVAGRDVVSKKFNSETLVRAIQRKQPRKLIFYLYNPKNLKPAMTTLLNTSSLKTNSSKLKAILIMMGAGDIFNYTGSLLR